MLRSAWGLGLTDNRIFVFCFIFQGGVCSIPRPSITWIINSWIIGGKWGFRLVTNWKLDHYSARKTHSQISNQNVNSSLIKKSSQKGKCTRIDYINCDISSASMLIFSILNWFFLHFCLKLGSLCQSRSLHLLNCGRNNSTNFNWSITDVGSSHIWYLFVTQFSLVVHTRLMRLFLGFFFFFCISFQFDTIFLYFLYY